MKSVLTHKVHYAGVIETSSPNSSKMYLVRGIVWYGCRTTSSKLLEKARLLSIRIQQSVSVVVRQPLGPHAKHAICETFSMLT